MDRRRMDAEGGRVVYRDRRARKLAVVVAAQNLLVAACLLVTLCLYFQEQASGDDSVHIQFDASPSISGNVTLQFGHIRSSNKMGLVDKKKDTVYVNCTGPYVLYMDVCYTGLGGEETRAILQLQVVGNETPVSNFTLHASREVCRGLHSIAYLRANEEASLHLYSTNMFRLKNATVGLSYLLGGRCVF